MVEIDQTAPLPPEDSTPNSVMDEDTRLRSGFVDKVLDAVDAGDDETARRLVEPLHPAARGRGHHGRGGPAAARLRRARPRCG